MKVTLFGQRVFEDAVKSRILNEVIWTRLHPTCSDRHRKRGMGWRSGRTLSSPPLMSAPQSQLPAEPLLRKKDCNLPKKIFYIQNKEESTMTSILQRDRKEETPLVIQRLRPCSPNAGGPDSIPSQGTKVLHAKKIGKKKKKGETVMKLTILLRDRRGDRRRRGRDLRPQKGHRRGTWPPAKQPL